MIMGKNTLMITVGILVFLIVVFLIYKLVYKKKQMFNSGSGYRVLDKKQKVSSNLNNGILAILAPWCGYCKKMKASGLLKKVSETISVVEIDDKHPDSAGIMEKLKAPGFPTLIVVTNGKMSLYKGDRTVEGILKEF
jgi:thiol-disulfide isomerase/thioredoxin